MAIIDNLIPQQNFELIRDRIGLILADELSNQLAKHGDASLNPTVGIERYKSFNITELNFLSVNLARGPFDNKNAIQVDGSYLYNIDGYVSAKSTDSDDGDNLSSIKLQRILGMVRAILENPGYDTLAFVRGNIGHTEVQELTIAEPDRTEKEHVMMGRLNFLVRASEDVELTTPPNIALSTTTIKLELTEKGYVYIVS